MMNRPGGETSVLRCAAVTAAIEPMIGLSKLATIECATCSALREIYPQDVPGEPSLGWTALDDGHLCKALPLRRRLRFLPPSRAHARGGKKRGVNPEIA
jgi:hypothetical protein